MNRQIILCLLSSVFLFTCSEGDESSEKKIISFVFESSLNPQLAEPVSGVIDEGSRTITATFPFHQQKTALTPTIDVSPEASVNPGSGQPTDFSSPVSYAVKAGNGSIATYTVNVVNKATPTIASVTPNAGAPGMIVKITGNNFKVNRLENLVKFHGVTAEVVTASETELEVKVPGGGSSGPISLTIEGGTVEGPSFTFYEIYIIGKEFDQSKNRVIPKVWKNGISMELAWAIVRF